MPQRALPRAGPQLRGRELVLRAPHERRGVVRFLANARHALCEVGEARRAVGGRMLVQPLLRLARRAADLAAALLGLVHAYVLGRLRLVAQGLRLRAQRVRLPRAGLVDERLRHDVEERGHATISPRILLTRRRRRAAELVELQQCLGKDHRPGAAARRAAVQEIAHREARADALAHQLGAPEGLAAGLDLVHGQTDVTELVRRPDDEGPARELRSAGRHAAQDPEVPLRQVQLGQLGLGNLQLPQLLHGLALLADRSVECEHSLGRQALGEAVQGGDHRGEPLRRRQPVERDGQQLRGPVIQDADALARLLGAGRTAAGRPRRARDGARLRQCKVPLQECVVEGCWRR
mmetsp:Transcript_60335/g.155470  ORF Transcript_60335/g.155470 Transcript_60335/m.155470 type:complete len:349 (+) Transcript_60335:668-1714(+)